MPLVLGLGREVYSCRDIYHSGKTCRQFIAHKLSGSLLNGLKLYFFATFLPLLSSKRRQLVSGNWTERVELLRKALVRYLRGSLFIMLGNSIPWIILCTYPFNSPAIRKWSIGSKMMLVNTLPATLSLAVESSDRMSAYMGFIVSKAISQAWRLMKKSK